MEGKWKLHDQNSIKIIFLILRFMVICSSKKKVFGYFLYGFLSLRFLFWSTKFNIIFKIVTMSISITYRLLSRGVHKSVWVGFVPNPKPTHSHRVRSWTTRRRPPAISGRVGSSSVGQWLGQSKMEWVSTSRSSPNLRQESLNLRWISPNLCCIFAKSVDFSLELCDNQDIEARKTTSSPDMNENFHLIIGSSSYLHWIFAGSVDFSSDLCGNHGIEAKNTTSSPNLSKNYYLIAESNQNYEIFTESEWI